jgi:hypothetical protein
MYLSFITGQLCMTACIMQIHVCGLHLGLHVKIVTMHMTM